MSLAPATDLAARFEAKVDRSPGLGPNGDCHLWTGAPSSMGYGRLSIGARGEAVELLAHRVAWLLAHGAWPEPCALHHCDTPLCVRSEHLFEGTPADNVIDMVSKGRQRRQPTVDERARGERQGASKLTVVEVLAILSDRRSLSTIAADYGVTKQAIWLVQKRKNWAHV